MSFVLKNIRITLEPESISNAIEEINNFERRLKPAMTHLIDRLCAKGVEIAKATLIFFEDPAYDTGALSDSVKYEVLEDKGIISAGEGLVDGQGKGSYAIYVEYGTGIYYEGTKRPNGWVYYNDRIGKFVFTFGMAPRPFMHNTMLSLEDEAKTAGGRIIAEYLKE